MDSKMEQNETNGADTAERNPKPCRCSCGCGGKGSNKLAVAIWAALLFGVIGILGYFDGKPRRLMRQADELYKKHEFEASTECLRQAAELGDPWAQVYYGERLKNGVGTKMDAAAAVEWFRKAAARNNPDAFYMLGICYADGDGVERDPKKAGEFYRKAAELGNPWAQVRYGERLKNGGPGVEKNVPEAVKWFRKSADQNCYEGLYQLGLCFEKGEGVERDSDKAKEYYRKAAESLRHWADRDNPWAQVYYGEWLKTGFGVEKNVPEAVKWFRRSAELNCPDAFYQLGICYENGEGVAVDLNEAEAWYRKALVAGYGPSAQNDLDRIAWLRSTGAVVTSYAANSTRPDAVPRVSEADRLLQEAQDLYLRQDFAASMENLRRSAELGNPWAQAYCGEWLMAGGFGVEKDASEAVKWFRRSAELNCPEAFYQLGICYENGEGVAADPDEAEAWYRKALDAGFGPPARESLDRIANRKTAQNAGTN